MAKPKVSADQNVFQFPSGEPAGVELAAPPRIEQVTQWEAVLSGTYRKDPEGLKLAYEELNDIGCRILSPSNVDYASEVDGFVYMQGEERELPQAIELRHLEAIQKAHFVWLHAPEGYVGPTAALEVGFARAIGIPIFARNPIKDSILQSFVQVVSAPLEVLGLFSSGKIPVPSPALNAFQNYYRRAAVQRGYEKETAKDTLLLMVEEFGELARAIREREKLTRHGRSSSSEPGQEMADVFIYLVHLANVLGFDLSKAVEEKELLNLKRFLQR